MKKREWAYVQNPKEYSVDCDICGGDNVEWSEFDHMIWCYDCEKDTKGTDGLFNGPICYEVCKLMGTCFDRYNIKTGEIEKVEDFVNNKLT